MENLSNISDMYIGQITYYCSKFYFINDKLDDYKIKFNNYINDNFEYTKESSPEDYKKQEEEKKRKKNKKKKREKNKKDNSKPNARLTTTNNNTDLILTGSKLKTHKRDKKDEQKRRFRRQLRV